MIQAQINNQSSLWLVVQLENYWDLIRGKILM